MRSRSRTGYFVAISVGLAANALAATVPAELQGPVQSSARLGMTLYVHDAAASRATDALLNHGELSKHDQVRGWLTSVADDRRSVSVVFVGEVDRRPAAFLLSKVPAVSGNLEVNRFPQPVELTGDLLSLWRARELAVKLFESETDLCAEHYNPVVFSNEKDERDTILVYFLPAPERVGVAITGGHIRYEIARDGSQILSRKQVGDGCTEVQIDEGTLPYLSLVRPSEAVPSEIEVYLSRQYSRPIVVTTLKSNLTWKVDGPRIEIADLQQ
jgi:hypothetical protein